MASFFQQKWALPAIALLGLGLAIIIVNTRPDLEHHPQAAVVTSVAVITVEEHKVRPTITGFGSVAPDRSLDAKAEVSGRVTYVHPALKKGAILPADTLALTIDDTDYQLALRQAQADLLVQQANLTEMQQTVDNVALELTLAQEKLAVRERELRRLEKLQASGSVSQSNLDAERQRYLQQQQEVQKLENQSRTLPSNIDVVKARIAMSEAKLEQSQRNLDRTRIQMPFTGRVSHVAVEADQYITTGSPMFSAFSMEKMLVNAQFPMDQFAQLAAHFDREKLMTLGNKEGPAMDQLFVTMGLSAEVSLADSPFESWTATVERLSDNLDPQSRTIGVVVSVKDSYAKMIPGRRPPLMEGMYMRVVLKGAPKAALVIPRSALHQQHVFVATADDRLQRTPLEIAHLQGEIALLESGLNAGDRVVVSDPFPALDGMPLTPELNDTAQQQLSAWVAETL